MTSVVCQDEPCGFLITACSGACRKGAEVAGLRLEPRTKPGLMCVSREAEAGQQSDTCGASPGNVKAPGSVSASVWEERAETGLGTLKPLSFLVVCLTAKCCEKQAPCGFAAGHLRGRLRDRGGGEGAEGASLFLAAGRGPHPILPPTDQPCLCVSRIMPRGAVETVF